MSETFNILRDAKSIVQACEQGGLIKRTFSNSGSYAHDKQVRQFTIEHRQKLSAARAKRLSRQSP